MVCFAFCGLIPTFVSHTVLSQLLHTVLNTYHVLMEFDDLLMTYFLFLSVLSFLLAVVISSWNHKVTHI